MTPPIPRGVEPKTQSPAFWRQPRVLMMFAFFFALYAPLIALECSAMRRGLGSRDSMDRNSAKPYSAASQMHDLSKEIPPLPITPGTFTLVYRLQVSDIADFSLLPATRSDSLPRLAVLQHDSLRIVSGDGHEETVRLAVSTSSPQKGGQPPAWSWARFPSTGWFRSADGQERLVALAEDPMRLVCIDLSTGAIAWETPLARTRAPLIQVRRSREGTPLLCLIWDSVSREAPAGLQVYSSEGVPLLDDFEDNLPFSGVVGFVWGAVPWSQPGEDILVYTSQRTRGFLSLENKGQARRVTEKVECENPCYSVSTLLAPPAEWTCQRAIRLAKLAPPGAGTESYPERPFAMPQIAPIDPTRPQEALDVGWSGIASLVPEFTGRARYFDYECHDDRGIQTGSLYFAMGSYDSHLATIRESDWSTPHLSVSLNSQHLRIRGESFSLEPPRSQEAATSTDKDRPISAARAFFLEDGFLFAVRTRGIQGDVRLFRYREGVP